MTKYNQLFKQQIVNFYFEYHENLAFTLKHFNLAAKPLDIELHNTNIPALMDWRYYATKDFTPLNLNIVSFTPFSLVLLVVGQLTRSTFFYHRQSKPDRDSTLKARIRDIKHAEPNYGYRRASAKLLEVSHKRVQRLIQEMLLQAVKKLPKNANLILHSDQEIHYQMPSYQRLLAKNRISQSMSRKGNCLDNAAMESFFGRMKTECFHGKSFTRIDELEKVINDYVRYYNEERIQLKLKGLSPIQYRKQSFK